MCLSASARRTRRRARALAALLVATATYGCAADVGEKRLSSSACAVAEAVGLPNYDVRWTPPRSAIAAHQAFRKRAGASLPSAPTTVHVHASTNHFSGAEWSFVAVRRPDGRWHASRVGEETGGLLAARPSGGRTANARSTRRPAGNWTACSPIRACTASRRSRGTKTSRRAAGTSPPMSSLRSEASPFGGWAAYPGFPGGWWRR